MVLCVGDNVGDNFDLQYTCNWFFSVNILDTSSVFFPYWGNYTVGVEW